MPIKKDNKFNWVALNLTLAVKESLIDAVN